MTESHAPVAGWYDDPEMALRLRWWDGIRWTQHTRPKPVVEHPAEQAVSGQDPLVSGQATATGGSAIIAEPVAAEPYAYSAPYSWSPGSAAVVSPSAPASVDDLWNTTATSIDYAPERTTTPASWALALTPLVTVLAQAAAITLSGFESTPWIWIAGAAVIPVLWIAMWVRRDRITLYEWGHLERAPWGWAFLTEVGYLAARTMVIRRHAAGRGWWPLVTNLLLIAVLVNIGIFTPVVGLVVSTIS